MTDLTFSFSLLIPALVLALLAVALPELCRYIAARLLKRMKPHIASWLSILLESYIIPLAMILRVFLAMLALGSAISVLPFDALRSENVTHLLDIASDLLCIFYIGLGSWRAAPVTRLLLHSAENHLDIQTHQTMGRFFENIFHKNLPS